MSGDRIQGNGMDPEISRRGFLNGVVVTSASVLIPSGFLGLFGKMFGGAGKVMEFPLRYRF